MSPTSNKILLLGKGFEYRLFYTSVLLPEPFRSIEKTAIVLHGSCNFSCRYCKRDGNFVDEKGNIIGSQMFYVDEVFKFIEKNAKKSIMFRISGGDPITMKLDDYIMFMTYARNSGVLTSIATNMSVPRKINKMIDYVDYVAGDLKAPLRYWRYVVGNSERQYYNEIESWKMLLSDDYPLCEIRFPVFPFTTTTDFLEAIRPIRDLIESDKDRPVIVLRAYRKVDSFKQHESTSPEHIISVAKNISRHLDRPVLVRIKWRYGTLLIYPDGKVKGVSKNSVTSLSFDTKEVKLWKGLRK